MDNLKQHKKLKMRKITIEEMRKEQKKIKDIAEYILKQKFKKNKSK
ncbi:hypothetical protein [Tepidibacter mesophilus]|nr:hypothetical protein [Tepidibacter mesophilus]